MCTYDSWELLKPTQDTVLQAKNDAARGLLFFLWLIGAEKAAKGVLDTSVAGTGGL
jgi:hypothetical protein